MRTHLLKDSLITSTAGRIKLSIFLFLFVFATTYPKYIEILNDVSPENTYAYFFEKINHPLTPTEISEVKTHGSKIAFRLIPPLIGKLLGVHLVGNGKGIIVIYIIQSLLLLPFLYLLIVSVQRITDNLTTILLAVSFSAVYVTKAFFWDYDFWFDGYAYFFLMVSIYSKNKGAIFIFSQLACWTDERAAIALYPIFIYHLLTEKEYSSFSLYEAVKINFKSNSTVILISGLVYVLLRTFFSYYFKLNTPLGEEAGVGFNVISFQLANRLIGVFLSFEGLWLIFLMALMSLMSQKKFFLIILLLSIAVLHILVAYSVYDITRSLSYAFPLFLICIFILAKNKSSSHIASIQLSTLACILIPTQFLIFFTRQIPWTVFSYPEIKVVLKNLIMSL